jgi:pilus assembly protein TadC
VVVWHHLGHLGPLAVVGATLAGIAAALLVEGPRRRLSRSAIGESPSYPRWHRLGRWLLGRDDALSIGRRSAVAIIASGCLVLGLSRTGILPSAVGWVALPPLALIMIISLGRLEPAGARRRRQQLIMEAPQALELLGSCLAAGLPLRRAVAAVTKAYGGPVAEDLGRVLRMVELGAPDPDAWRSLRGHPQLGPAATDLARSVESGTMLVETLNHHARAARADRHAALQVRARAVGVRSVLPLMICFLPAFLLLGVLPSVVSAILKAFP